MLTTADTCKTSAMDTQVRPANKNFLIKTAFIGLSLSTKVFLFYANFYEQCRCLGVIAGRPI